MKIDLVKFISNNPVFSPSNYSNWLDWMRHAIVRGEVIDYTEDQLIANYSVSINGNVVASGRRVYHVYLKESNSNAIKNVAAISVPRAGGLKFEFYSGNSADMKQAIETDTTVTTIGSTPTTFVQRMTQLWQNHGGHGGVTCTSLLGSAPSTNYGEIDVHSVNYNLQAGDVVTVVVNGVILTDTVTAGGLVGISISLVNSGMYIQCEDLTIPGLNATSSSVTTKLQIGVQPAVTSPVGQYQSQGVDRSYSLIVPSDGPMEIAIHNTAEKLRFSVVYLNALETLWIADHFWDGEMIASTVGTWVSDALTEAQEYTDEKVGDASTDLSQSISDSAAATLNAAKAYSDTQDAETLAEAKNYTDEHSSSENDYDSLYVRG